MKFYSKAKLKMVGKREYVNTKINGHTLKLLLDTGGDISILNEQPLKKIGCPPLKSTKKKKIAGGVSG